MRSRPVGELLEDLDSAMDAARGAGADVSEAEDLRHLAKAHLLQYHEVEATEAIERAVHITDEAHRARVEQLIEEARTVLDQAGGDGVDLDDAQRQISEAREASEASDYEAAVWLLNRAVQSMGDGVRIRAEALGSLARNQWLFEQLRRFEPVPDTIVDAVGAQEDLVSRGDYGGSLKISGKVSQVLEVRLTNHMEGLLTRSKGYAGDLRRAGLKAEARRARKGHRLAHRHTRMRDTRTAIAILMELEREHDEAMDRTRLISDVG